MEELELQSTIMNRTVQATVKDKEESLMQRLGVTRAQPAPALDLKTLAIATGRHSSAAKWTMAQRLS